MKEYDSNKTTNDLMYVYANNLYGWAMIKFLPANWFTWITHKDDQTYD